MPVAVYQSRGRDTGAQGLGALVEALKVGTDVYDKNFGDTAKKREIELQNAQDEQERKQDFADSGAQITGPGLAEHLSTGKIAIAKPDDKGASPLLVHTEPYQKRMIGSEEVGPSDPRYQNATPVKDANGNFIPTNVEKVYVKPGGLDAAQMKADMALEIAKAKGAQTNIRIDGQNERYNNSAHDRHISSLNKDKQLNDLLMTRNNLDNAVKTFVDGGRSPSEFAELQQAIRSNLGIKGSGGVHERSETYWKSLGLNAQKAQQFLFGKPEDVMKSSPDAVEQILGLAKIEMENKNKQAIGRLNQIKSGFGTFYKKKGNEGYSDDFDNAGKMYLDQFSEISIPTRAQMQPQQSESPGLWGSIKSLFGGGSSAPPPPDDLQKAAQLELTRRQGMAGNLPKGK